MKLKLKLKLTLFVLFLCGIGLLVNGCLTKPSCTTDPGTLQLKLTLAEGQMHSQALAGDIRQIHVTLLHKDDKVTRETQVDFSGDGQEIAIFDLYPGDWQAIVSGLDESGSAIFQGIDTVFIRPAETSSILISLLPAPGFLAVECDVSQIPGLAADTNGTLYVYLNPEDSNTKYYSLIRNGNLVKATVSIPEGTFEVKVAVPNVSTKLFVSPYYTINIQAGKTTTLTITANGSLSVSGTINSTPSTPSGLVSVYNSQTSSVSITWAGVSDSDLAGYRLYRNNSEGRMIRIATINKDTLCFSNKVSPEDFFHNELKYAVSSYDLGGVESFWSEMASVRR
jgi:hypothetical protein